MTSLVQDIQFVRSLRKDIRELKLSASALSSIETIHNCIKSGTDLNGWKKVDWRNGSSRGNSGGNGGGGNPGQRGSQASTGHGFNRGPGSGFFNGGSRQSNNGAGERQEQSSHYAFGGSRSKGGFTGRQASEQLPSIPLTAGTTTNAANTTSASSPVVGADGFRPVNQKYVSKFKKTSDKVEDTILNTIILGKLNKFSEQNYAEIKEFITHIIDSGQTEMIKCFMKLVFEKAASEEMFCPLYAKLLSELSAGYPVLLTEMANLYTEYMEIFEEVLETDAENYNEVCKRNVAKKYRRGYSQFLAELIKHDVIDTDVFMKTITKIISQIEGNIVKKEASKLNEEYADCFMRIMKAIQTDSINDDDSLSDDGETQKKIEAIREQLKSKMVHRIQPLSTRTPENVGLSNKARFTLLDIYESIQKF